MDKLIEKIKTLFAYRDFEYLYQIGGIKKKKKDKLEANLIRLQQDIYFLDEYLESNWELDPVKLKSYWNRIHQSLSNLGVASRNYDHYSAHIYKYQKHEEQLRTDKDLLRLSLEYFYFYKSCDVKLMRRLIYDKSPIISKTFSLSDWRYFDLITEVNDDVDDLIEDLRTINGNRLQLGINKYGIESAKVEFLEFMQEILKQSEKRLTMSKGKQYDYIHSKVIEQVNETRLLLNVRLREYILLENNKKQVG